MKVIIIGKANGWSKAPQEGETWGVNDLCLRRDVKLVFDMHWFDTPERSNDKTNLKVIDYVNKNKIPIVTLKTYDYIPTSIAFPIEEVHYKYFSNGISYMIAYAIHQGYTEIDIYGVHMGLEVEYVNQKPCVDYWIGYARGKDIKVTVHEPTALCKSPGGLYGYGNHPSD